MAREPRITRTIPTTRATLMCLDIETQQTEQRTVDLPRTYKNNAAVLETAKKIIETDTLKAVHVITAEIIEERYAMSEIDFIRGAEKIKPLIKKTKPAPTKSVKK